MPTVASGAAALFCFLSPHSHRRVAVVVLLRPGSGSLHPARGVCLRVSRRCRYNSSCRAKGIGPMSAQQCRLRPRWDRPSICENGCLVVGHDDGSDGGGVGKDGDEEDAGKMVIVTMVLVMKGDDARW